jgi:sigma-54 dependent transcriptional regulator, acetoin dehydrogenase operon transcriptional activator AcoR
MAETTGLIPPHAQPAQRRRYLDRAWLRFIEQGEAAPGLPPEIARSWLRARQDYGVDPTLRRPLRTLRGDELEVRRRRDPAYRLALPILEEFAARLGSMKHVLAYFDAAGWMLSIQGHQPVLERVAGIAFTPGACWSEESAGTNGPGTAIAEAKPVEVFASEHFVEAWQPWSCSAAPVLRPGEAAPTGLVDITGPWDAHSPQAIVLAKAIARAIEERLAVAISVRDEVIRFAFRAARGRDEPLLAVDEAGRILATNGPAATRIGLAEGRLPPDLRQEVERLVAGAGQGDGELSWRDLRLVAHPVLHDGCPVGAVLRSVEEGSAAARPRGAGRPAAGGAPPRQAMRWSFEQILFESEGMRRAIELARVAARNDLPVVLGGESGTGKELYAQAIHGAGRRAAGPFVAVNCGSIPAPLVEAELFGYEPGAFTGGRRDGNPGKFEEAHGGTIFLDEVSELSPPGQTALLRVLQEREVVRLGGSAPRRLDVRVVAATNRDLPAEVAAGRFRQDLYYRLDVLFIPIPPLRQRVEDVPVLAQAFLAQAEAEVGRSGLSFTDEAIAALQAFPWPGNVRQLRNVVLRSAATAPRREIGALDLPPGVLAPQAPVAPRPGGPAAQEARELEALLARHGWNVARAADALGVSRMTLYRRLKRHGLARPG